MSQSLRDDFEMHPLAQQQAGVGVPKVVEPDALESDLGH